MELLLQVIWFLLPAGTANLVPPIIALLLPNWDAPMDFGLKFHQQRLLGSHKTIRGLITGVFMAAMVYKLQFLLATRYPLFQSWIINDSLYAYWWLGAWLGLLALMGDAIKSFLKRRLNIQPGESWFPWDQIDWVLASLAGTFFLLHFEPIFMVVCVIVGFVFSFVIRVIGYWLKIIPRWI